MNKLILAAVLPVLLTACASTSAPTSTTAEPREERVYRTGSNLPMRDPVSSSPTTTTTVDPSALRPGNPPRVN